MFFEKEYAAGRVRAMRSKLLAKETLQKTEDAKTVSDLMLYLAGTQYEHAFAGRNLEKCERALSAQKTKAVGKVLGFMPQEFRDAFLVFSLETDAKNLKRCLRGFSAGAGWSDIARDLDPEGIVFEKTKSAGADNLESLSFILSQTIWHEPIKKCLEYEVRENGLGLAEHEIEKFVFFRATESENYSIKRFFIEKRDLSDFRLVILCKEAGVPVPEHLLFSPEKKEGIIEKYSALSEGPLEKNINEHMLSFSRGLLQNEPFSSGLFIDFFCRKEYEAHHILRCARRACAIIAQGALEGTP